MPFSSHIKLIGIFSLLSLCVLSFAVLSFLKFTAHSPDPTTRLATPAKTASVTLPAKCGGWSIIPNAHANPGMTELFLGVAAVSVNDVWAVGNYLSSSGGTLGLIEHWNGKAWSVISHPNLGPNNASEHFKAVAASSTHDVWAVGDYTYKGAIQRTLAEHWNGSSWSIVSSPNPGSNWNDFSAITAISPHDVWAVGTFSSGSEPLQTLTEHWDGTTWSVVASPNAGSSDNNLLGVAAASTNDVWAIGRYFSLPDSSTQPLIEHWNGTAWSIVTNPSPGTTSFATYEAITAVSPQDVWVIGSYQNKNNTTIFKTLIEHWDGTTWQIVASPDVQTHSDYLIGVTAVSPTNVWTVGGTEAEGSQKVLIEHWDGTKWSIVRDANSLHTSSILRAVAQVPGTSYVWTVGLGSNSTFTAFYC